MDRSWISSSRLSAEYRVGVESFFDFASRYNNLNAYLHCPCRRCSNTIKCSLSVVKNHLFEYGFDPNYTFWKWHGEKQYPPMEGERIDRVHEDSGFVTDYDSVDVHDEDDVVGEIDELDTSME